MADLVQYYGTGRRKSSIARVFLRPGSGKFSVNEREFDEYFVTEQQRAAAKRSLGIAGIDETFDVITTVKGGGVMGQADAVKLGLARALMEFNPELRKTLKSEGLITARRALAHGSSSPSASCICWLSEHHPREQSARGTELNLPTPRWAGINPGTASGPRLNKEKHGKHHNEGTARSGCPLRPSDEALEPTDEGIHLR